MFGPSTHRVLSRNTRPMSSRDLSGLTNQEIDQLRKSHAEMRLTRWEAVKQFFWNSDDRTVCYWTGTSWLFIMTFYPVFVFLILLLFYGTMMLMTYIVQTMYDRPLIDKRSLTKLPNYN